MKNKISFIAFLLVILAIAFFNFKDPPAQLIAWDQFGYYLYLPLTFIYHDLGMKDFSVVEHLIHIYQPVDYFYQGIQLEDGSWVIRYTSGLAILYSPGFFAGHLFAYLLGYPMDGFSAPYQYALLSWSVVFLFVGLYYLRRILLHFFSDKISAFVLLIFYFGTNFLHISTHWGILLVHPYLLTLFSIMLWYTIKWHTEHKLSAAIIIGISLGLAAITRPTEILYMIIPVLWGIKSINEIREKIKIIFRDFRSHLFIASGIIFFFVCIQLGYWKAITGHFFYDSYKANAGEGFDFPPYLFQFLFSYRKGWLLYTPLMIFAIIGFTMLYKQKREIFFSCFIFFLAFLLVVSSWTYWWYASSFSQRTMVQVYPLLCVTLGFFIQWSVSRKNILKLSLLTVILLFVFLNLFQIWQHDNCIIDGERMTKKYYWKVFLKTAVPEGADSLLLIPRDEAYPKLQNEYKFIKSSIFSTDFEKDDRTARKIAVKDTVINFSNLAGKIDSSSEFYSLFDTRLKNLPDKYFFWVRVKVKIMPLKPIKKIDALLVISFLHIDRAYQYRTYPIANDSSLLYSWHDLQSDYLTPEIRSRNDRLQVYIWNRGKSLYAIDDVSIEIFEPQENP